MKKKTKKSKGTVTFRARPDKYSSEHVRPSWPKTSKDPQPGVTETLVEYLCRLIQWMAMMDGSIRHFLTGTGGSQDLKSNIVSVSESIGPLQKWKSVITRGHFGTKTSRTHAVDFVALLDLARRIRRRKSFPHHLLYANFRRNGQGKVVNWINSNEIYDWLMNNASVRKEVLTCLKHV